MFFVSFEEKCGKVTRFCCYSFNSSFVRSVNVVWGNAAPPPHSPLVSLNRVLQRRSKNLFCLCSLFSLTSYSASFRLTAIIPVAVSNCRYNLGFVIVDRANWLGSSTNFKGSVQNCFVLC